MAFESYRDYKNDAKQCRERAEYLEAAHCYTAAANEILGTANYATDKLDPGQVDTARGLRTVLASALCYRLAAASERSQIRCRQGILLCEELRDHVVAYDAQKGVMDEYIGDFRTIGNFGTPADDYQAARKRYKGVTNPIQWQAEPEFEMNLTFMLDLLDATGKSLEKQTKREITAESLIERIEYKMDEFDEIVETVVASGSWT